MSAPSREALAGLLRGRVTPSLRSAILEHDAAMRAEIERLRALVERQIDARARTADAREAATVALADAERALDEMRAGLRLCDIIRSAP